MSTIISLIFSYVSLATSFGSRNLVSWVLGLAWMTPLKTLQLDEWTIAWCGKNFVLVRPFAYVISCNSYTKQVAVKPNVLN